MCGSWKCCLEWSNALGPQGFRRGLNEVFSAGFYVCFSARLGVGFRLSLGAGSNWTPSGVLMGVLGFVLVSVLVASDEIFGESFGVCLGDGFG